MIGTAAAAGSAHRSQLETSVGPGRRSLAPGCARGNANRARSTLCLRIFKGLKIFQHVLSLERSKQ